MPPKLTRVVRLDSMPLQRAQFTDEGYLVDKPILTSIGIFEYKNPNGTLRRELRLPEEVFARESLESYRGKPVIVTHDAGLIDKNNVHDETIGTILSDGYKSGNDVRAEIIIHDTDEMRESGLKELSLGYNLELDETPGVWMGEHYDAIQRNIRVNHLALVREARAGEKARLNIDGRDSDTNTLQGGKAEMRKSLKKTRRNDGILSPEELAKAIEEYKKRRAGNADADEEEEKPVEEEQVVTDADEEEEKPEAVEEKIQFVKDRRDRRDEDGDPKSQKEAMGIIAHQDEDIDTLFDIIDTLLAERDFKKDAEEEEEKPVLEDPDEIAGDADDEEIVAEEEEVAEDADDEEAPAEEEEEIVEDADDEEIVAEEEEVAEDADDEEAPEEDEEFIEDEDDEDDEEFAEDCGRSRMDAVDKLVNAKLEVGMLGRQVGLKGLERMPIGKAKAKIIKAVRPNVRLDGKSQAYRSALYDMAVETIKKSTKKGSNYQRKQMFNKDSKISVSTKSGQASARDKMINRMVNRTNKEDK